MKKIIYLGLTVLMLSTSLVSVTKAQSVPDVLPDSKYRFGIKIAPSIDWFKPEDVKKLTNGGAKLKFDYGLMLEVRLNKVVTFNTGLEVNYVGGQLNTIPADSNYYDPKSFLASPAKGDRYRFFITSRVYNATYVDIPLLLKMRTPEVAHFTYFAMFGINISYRAKVKSNDVGILVTYKDTITDKVIKAEKDYELKDVNITKEMNLFNLGLNVGAGAEYKIAGTTALVVSLNFHNSFTNALKKTSETIYTYSQRDLLAPGDTGPLLTQIARLNYFQLNIGILF